MKIEETKYLILGTGPAAVAAVEGIRSRDAEGRILLLDQAEKPACKRPVLSKSPLLNFRKENSILREEKWFLENGLEFVPSCLIKSLEPGEYQVITSKGYYRYEKCIYALGGRNYIPPIPGKDKKNVLTIRTAEDLQAVRRLALKSSRAVIIGGGVIGLETALELCRYGIKVTVLEASPRLMPRRLDAYISEKLAEILREKMEIHTRVSIAGIEGDEKTAEVVLLDGRRFSGGVIVVSCGQKANADAARRAGIPCKNSVIVNERMETGVPDVWACGDCAEFEGMNNALWPQAWEEGKTAGVNAAGGNAVYAGSDCSLLMTAGKASIFSLGDLGNDPDAAYEVRTIQKQYTGFSINRKPEWGEERLYYREGKLVGCCLLGNLSRMKELKKEIEGGGVC